MEFVNADNNYTYVQDCIDKIYTQKKTINVHKDNLSNKSKCSEEMLSLAKSEGKGWLAILVSNELDNAVDITRLYIRSCSFCGARNNYS